MFRNVAIAESKDLGGEKATVEVIQRFFRETLGLEITAMVGVWAHHEGINIPSISADEHTETYDFDPNCLIEVYIKEAEPEASQLILAVVKEI